MPKLSYFEVRAVKISSMYGTDTDMCGHGPSNTATTGRSSILLIKIYLVPESSLLGTLRAVYPRRRHLYSDGLHTTEYTAFCFF